MITFLTAEEARDNYDTQNKHMKFVRDIWDNYNNPLPNKNGIIPMLAKKFPSHKPASQYKPLGDFKQMGDWEHLTREKIYDYFISQMRRTDLTEGTSMMRESVIFILKAFEIADYKAAGIKWNNKPVFINSQMAVDALCMMFWRCSDGVFLEVEVIKEISSMLEDTDFDVKAAPYEMESKDVDAIIFNRTTNVDEMMISIKNLGGLSENSVNTFRIKKGKKTPDIYIGFEKDSMRLGKIKGSEGSLETFERLTKKENIGFDIDDLILD